jgi:hypothetical protein
MTGAVRYRSTALAVAAVAAAWAVLVGVELSGQAPVFHHHALLNGTRPLWEAIAIFVPAWVVMIRRHDAAVQPRDARPGGVLTAVLGPLP